MRKTTGQLLDEFENTDNKCKQCEPRFSVGEVVGLAVGGIGQIIKIVMGKYTVRIRTANGLEVWSLQEFELRGRV